MYPISANLVHRELRNATFEGEKMPTSITFPDSGHASVQLHKIYSCYKEDHFLQIINLNVLQPPKLIYQEGSNGSVIVSEGDTLHLDCNAYGIPSPQIYWIYGQHDQSKFNGLIILCILFLDHALVV